MCWSCDCCWNVELWIGIKNMHCCLYPFPEPTNFQDEQWNPRFVGRSRVITTRQTRQCHLEDHVVGSRQAVDEDEVRPEMSDPAQPSPTQPNPARPKDPRFTCKYLEKLLVLDQRLHILHWFKQANHTKWTNHNQQLWQAVILSVIPLIIRCPLSGLVISGGYHLTRFEALCMQLEHTKHMAHYWKQQWRKASRQQLYSNWIVTLPQVSHSVSGLIPTILILFLLIRDLFWLFGSSTQANSSFPSFVERWYQISRHLDFQLNGLFMIKINSHHFKDFSGPANHTTQNETLGLRPG